MRTARVVPLVVAGAVLLLGATAGLLYATDYPIEATVRETHCAGPLQPDSENRVEVHTHFLGIDHTVRGIPDRECVLLQSGNFVRYHLRSHRTTLYLEEGGECVWDSKTGLC